MRKMLEIPWKPCTETLESSSKNRNPGTQTGTVEP